MKYSESYFQFDAKLAKFEFLVEEVGGAWRWEKDELKQDKKERGMVS